MARRRFETADCANYETLKENARQNRNNPTEAEQMLWLRIKGCVEGFKFRRQHIIDNYIADFCCLSQHLVIEVDGEYHYTSEQQLNDTQRTVALSKQGFRVIRFTNDEVLHDIDNVILTIKSELF